MVKNVLEKANRMLKGYGYPQDGIIEILTSLLFWKFKGEDSSKKPYTKEELINKTKECIQKDNRIGDYFLSQVIRLDDKIDDVKEKDKGINIYNNIFEYFDKIKLDTIQEKEDCLNVFIEFIADHTKYNFDYFTPPEVVKLMKRTITSDLNSFYDPFKRSGEFLIEANKIIGNSKNVVGEGDNKILNQIELLRKEVNGIEDSFKSYISSSDTPFDCIITNPPFGKSTIQIDDSQNPWNVYLTPKRQEYQILKNCLNKMSNKGKLAIVLPDHFIFSNELKKFREKIISDNLLESIVLLPKVFYHANVVTCIVVFNYKKKEETVSVIDLRKSGERRKNRDVISEEIIQEITNMNIHKVDNSSRYRFFNKKEFEERDFNFLFIKEIPKKVFGVNFQIEMEKLLVERRKIHQAHKKAQLKLNKSIKISS